jgi:hypothetical protein
VGVGQETDSLAAIAPRRAGSEAERRAARHLEKRLQEMGREVSLEPTRIRPAFWLAHLIHAVLGIVGSVLSVYQPLAGLVITVLAVVSALGDFTGTFQLARLFAPARASQNVTSDEDTGKPGLVVLVAHYDAPRGGMLTGPRLARLWPRALFWSLVVICVCAVARVIGIDAVWLTAVQYIPTVILIAMTPLFADAGLSDTTDGRADNAEGVAIALALANKDLEHFDVMLVFTGGSANDGLGMQPWLKRHRKELESEATAVICLDNFESDEPRYAEREGPVIASRMHPTLDDLASEDATRFNSRELSDAFLARAAGLPTLRISGGDTRFVAGLLDRIDAEIGPRLA